MTRQRMVILEELRKVNTHPSADEIYLEFVGICPDCRRSLEAGIPAAGNHSRD